MYDAVLELAWRQHGAFSIAQAERAGVSRSWVHRRLVAEDLHRPIPGVYVLAVSPVTARQRLAVHVLGAGDGALATGDSALGLWCPELALPAVPVVAAPVNCGYRAAGVRLLRSSDLNLARPGLVDGIPVAGVARALLDAARWSTADQVLARIDACRRHGPVAVGALIEALEVHARRGRPGITAFRAALQGLRGEVADSEFERLVVRDLAAAGLVDPVVHHVVHLAGLGSVELDLAWPARRRNVELDGRDHVDRSRRARRDRQRDRALTAAGWSIMRYTWDDYVAGPAAMIEEIVRFVLTEVGST